MGESKVNWRKSEKEKYRERKWKGEMKKERRKERYLTLFLKNQTMPNISHEKHTVNICWVTKVSK